MAQRRKWAHEEPPAPQELLSAVRGLARPLRAASDLDPLLERVGDARCVLFGEASHGTHEFYTWRAEISKRLIREKGFSFIAVEGDWPDCYRVHRFIKGYDGAGTDTREMLQGYERWPTWMWANEEIAELADWLRDHNRRQPAGKQVGFFGLDVYSLWDSLYQVLGYLRKTDGQALAAARKAFRCFAPHGEDAQRYARFTRYEPHGCENEVVNLLMELRRQIKHHDGDPEAAFVAEQNALVLRNAETYYRTMIRGQAESWNVRDRHMAETLDRLLKHHGPQARAIVWEHNTHVGDARFTDMADEGMVNLGQLAREAYGEGNVVLFGFGTHRGTVIAGAEWEAPMEEMDVPAGRPGSWEDVLHRVGPENKLLVFGPEHHTGPVAEERGHRAIGVVYHSHYEHFGNYVPTVLPRRYDAFLYVDQTRALELLPTRPPAVPEVPETYPSGV